MATTRTLYGSSRFASSSSLIQPCWSYDVFLSFRGEDTRKNFTNHLYAALVHVGIHIFMDDDELPRGHDISSVLLKSIEESRISIIVFSTNYASSIWCLDELVKIIIYLLIHSSHFSFNHFNSKKTLGQLILPLFYYADPSDVRHQIGCFGEAFRRHEKRYVDEMVKVEVRKVALSESTNLSSWDLQNVANESDDVRMIAIYGLGGIGKTTVAKVVYNHIFLQSKGRTKNLKIGSVDRGLNLMKERLHSKKVLIVLDDVDQSSQLNTLARNRDWFGPGSRIIKTTRDEHLLKGLKVDERYMPKELNHTESLQFFSWHAFRETNPLENFAELANDIASYARGLPLALEILGSYLFRRNILEWKSALDELQQIPHHQIQKKLRISFDLLDNDRMKDIFLDIACFFIGSNKDYVITILNSCGFFAQNGISVLVSRCLLRISERNELLMHDLLGDMGKEIIREKYSKEPEKRSRLWYFLGSICKLKSIKHLNLTGCAKLEEFLEHLGHMESLTELLADRTTIKQLPFSIGLLKNLRRLSLKGCLCSLTELDLSDHNLFEGDFPADLRSLSSLRVLDLSGNNFCNLPYGFSHLSKPEDLKLNNCRSLQSILDLPSNLLEVQAYGCALLEKISDLSKLKTLLM
ncbi:TMV resistance protein N-like [Camellia sinensis]|uniref:TMV resistance protein N-like n=1 Tax=Camellia sinensis TaxID=4442 RepID=UPI001036C3AD|nr:TMV resistance protein N-like [Camellia sinensis]